MWIYIKITQLRSPVTGTLCMSVGSQWLWLHLHGFWPFGPCATTLDLSNSLYRVLKMWNYTKWPLPWWNVSIISCTWVRHWNCMMSPFRLDWFLPLSPLHMPSHIIAHHTIMRYQTEVIRGAKHSQPYIFTSQSSCSESRKNLSRAHCTEALQRLRNRW